MLFNFSEKWRYTYDEKGKQIINASHRDDRELVQQGESKGRSDFKLT